MLKSTLSMVVISRWTRLLMRLPHWSETLSILRVESGGRGTLDERHFKLIRRAMMRAALEGTKAEGIVSFNH